MLKCEKCGNDTFKNEERYSSNGLLESIIAICTKCGKVKVLPFKKEQEFRHDLRERQENKCFTCDKENPRTLHHRDSNPDNRSNGNLVLICGKCHRKLNRVKDILRSASPGLAKEILQYSKTVQRWRGIVFDL